jgi:hypothetical protein
VGRRSLSGWLPILALVTAGCGSGQPGASPGSSVSGATGAAPTSPSDPGGLAGRSHRPSAAAQPTSKPLVSVKGSGFEDSRSFKLGAGTYVVHWKISSSNSAGCAAIGALRTPDGKVSVEVANTTLAGKGSQAGQQVATKMKAATYVITFATTCSWTAAIYRR